MAGSEGRALPLSGMGGARVHIDLRARLHRRGLYRAVAAVVRHDASNRTKRRDVPAGSVGLCGEEPIHWIRVPSASDMVEVTAHPGLRVEIAESMGVARHAHLGDLHSWFDFAVVAIASRLRAAARGWSGLSDVGRDELVRCLYAHVYRSKFGGRWPSSRPRACRRVSLQPWLTSCANVWLTN